MSLCGLPGCSSTADRDKQTCRFHIGMERFISPPNLGTGMRRLNDATPEGWDAASAKSLDTWDTSTQPAPIPSAGPALWDLVEQDMQGRDHFGKHKYGVRLQPHNGRDFLVDAYQEALDLVVYLRGVIYERDGK